MPLDTFRCVYLSIRAVRLPFRFSFRHAAADRRENRALIVELGTDAGTVAYGEIVPRDYLTGETVASCLTVLREELWPRLRALEWRRDTRPEATLASLYEWADAAGATAAYAGLDIAAFDVWARTFGIRGDELLAPSTTARATARDLTAPVGMGMPPLVVASALRTAGFREFKVKVGAALADSLPRVAAVRRYAGKDAKLRIDANGAWPSASAALVALPHYKELGVEAVEQPLPRGDLAGMQRLAAASGVGVVADESLTGLRDAAALIAAASNVRWNLRLAKVGGFSGILRLAALARRHGISYQLGALVGESSLLTAALRACLSTLTPTSVECSFPSVLLRHDPFRPSPFIGARLPPLGEAKGLGVEPDVKHLKAQTISVLELR